MKRVLLIVGAAILIFLFGILNTPERSEVRPPVQRSRAVQKDYGKPSPVKTRDGTYTHISEMIAEAGTPSSVVNETEVCGSCKLYWWRAPLSGRDVYVHTNSQGYIYSFSRD